MPSILFRGAFLRHAVLQDDEEAGAFRRIHFTADFSDPVRQHMGWDDLPDGLTSGKLSGELNGTHLVLTPNGKDLKRHELQISCSQVNDFQVFRVKNDDGETTRTELRFIVRSNQPGAMALIEAYKEAIGRGVGVLKIAHEKQEDLPFESEESKDDQPVLKDEETGEPILSGEAAEQHAVLASKRQVEIAENGGKPPAKPKAPRGPVAVN